MERVVLCIILGLLFIAQTKSAPLKEVIDFSNLDLKDFKYFKNLPSKDPSQARSVDPILEHFQKKKAILEYLGRLLLGNDLFGPAIAIEFNPSYADERQPLFEHTYGKHADRLIALLGSGASEEELKYYGAIPNDFGSYF